MPHKSRLHPAACRSRHLFLTVKQSGILSFNFFYGIAFYGIAKIRKIVYNIG